MEDYKRIVKEMIEGYEGKLNEEDIGKINAMYNDLERKKPNIEDWTPEDYDEFYRIINHMLSNGKVSG